MRRFGLIAALFLGTAGAALAAEPLRLALPVRCDPGRTCIVQNYVDHDASAGAHDFACGFLTYDGHDGTDFRLLSLAAMRDGVAVVAAADGRVTRVRDGMADVSIRAAGDALRGRDCGNGVVVAHRNGWETQYCHMAQGSVTVAPGTEVRAGDPLGRVGLSGRTEFPHLHLTVRHDGKAVDPFAFEPTEGRCGSGTSLWEPSLRAALSYRAGLVLNSGFAAGPVTADEVESGDAGRPTPGPDASALVAFVRSVGLRAGDIQRIVLRGPEGAVLTDSTAEPLDRPKAQVLMFAGKKRTGPPWTRGTYRATYTVRRGGEIVIDHAFEVRF